MCDKMGSLIKWPSREALQRTMPFWFRINYGLKVVAIIDCFEICIKKPSELLAKACMWSQYKHYNTTLHLDKSFQCGLLHVVSKLQNHKIVFLRPNYKITRLSF